MAVRVIYNGPFGLVQGASGRKYGWHPPGTRLVVDDGDESEHLQREVIERPARPALVDGCCPPSRKAAPVQRSEEVSAVWVYFGAGAIGEELRYSMRSVSAHVRGIKNIVLCGDRPQWYQGDFIDCPKITRQRSREVYGFASRRKWLKWTDSIHKLLAICDSPLVTDRFLWFYDDTFIMHPVEARDLCIARAGGMLSGTPKNKNKWRQCMTRTREDLESRGYPTRNFSTHYLMAYQKTLLRQTVREFDLPRRPRLFESVYGNVHYGRSAKSIRNVFQYRKNPRAGFYTGAPVLNVGSFNASARAVIEPRFPDRCCVEVGGPGDALTDMLTAKGYEHCERCAATAAWMNQKGWEWCRDNVSVIADRMLQNAGEGHGPSAGAAKMFPWMSRRIATRYVREALSTQFSERSQPSEV